MAQRNDDELALYLADLVRTAGHISDQERDWYLTQLSVAQPFTGPKHINDIWQAYWLSLGIAQGSVNDMAYAWLVSIGIPAGHINDMWHSYFDSAYPAVLDTALVWNDESTLVISGPDVTGWNNKGTGGAVYDLIGRSSGAQGPLLTTQNGINCIDLSIIANTDRKYMTPAAGTIIAQPLTIMIACKLDLLATAQRVLFDAITGGSRVFIQSEQSSTAFTFNAGVGVTAGPGSEDLLPHVFTLIGDGATGGTHVTDVDDNSPIDVGSNSLTYVTLGANLNGFQSWSGQIFEKAVFDYHILDQERLNIESFWRNKWGF